MTPYPQRVRIVEVGPRDGLQNEAAPIATEAKVAYILKLAAAGLPEIEVTSFVRPDRVPQLADADEVLALVQEGGAEGGRSIFTVLAPNERGLERAMRAGARRIAVFTAASDEFATRNIGMDVATSLRAFRPVARRALENALTVRGYVSTCFVCPYSGRVDPAAVLPVAESLLEMGVDEISLGDTVGAAVPTDVERLLEQLTPALGVDRLALHLHDTSGTALANVLQGMRMGIARFDSSSGGLGGCPFAPGAAGNLATEDLLYMLHGMAIETGVSLERVAAASELIAAYVPHPLPSKQLQRLHAACQPA